jgi:hypothetical protein
LSGLKLADFNGIYVETQSPVAAKIAKGAVYLTGLVKSL